MLHERDESGRTTFKFLETYIDLFINSYIEALNTPNTEIVQMEVEVFGIQNILGFDFPKVKENKRLKRLSYLCSKIILHSPIFIKKIGQP
jgi:hypothetical protein